MKKSFSEKTKQAVPLWVQLLIWVILAGILLLVAVGLIKAQTPILKVGSVVPTFTLPLFNGYEFNGESEINTAMLRNKVIVINFWASWCKPCEGEAEELEEAWRFYQTTPDVVFLGIDYVDTELEARAYLTRFDITYPNGQDIGTRISQIFNRNLGVPETFFIDRNSILRYVKIGPFQSVEEIREIVDSLISEK
jgi:cytochrome c biogenesis protein CcmG/thiol:disulfide interchange protein DsbE